MVNSLSRTNGIKPDCNSCVEMVEPIAVSAMSLSFLSDLKGSVNRSTDINKIVQRLQKFDPAINSNDIDNLASYKY